MDRQLSAAARRALADPEDATAQITATHIARRTEEWRYYAAISGALVTWDFVNPSTCRPFFFLRRFRTELEALMWVRRIKNSWHTWHRPMTSLYPQGDYVATKPIRKGDKKALRGVLRRACAIKKSVRL